MVLIVSSSLRSARLVHLLRVDLQCLGPTETTPHTGQPLSMLIAVSSSVSSCRRAAINNTRECIGRFVVLVLAEPSPTAAGEDVIDGLVAQVELAGQGATGYAPGAESAHLQPPPPTHPPPPV